MIKFFIGWLKNRPAYLSFRSKDSSAATITKKNKWLFVVYLNSITILKLPNILGSQMVYQAK